MMPALRSVVLSTAVGCWGAALVGQCAPQWLPGFGHLGADGAIHVLRYWDADGAGPETHRLVAGGAFTVVGATPAPGIAVYDLAARAWVALPGGMVDTVRDITLDAANRLVVAGARTVGGVTTHLVARWNGVAWTQLGPAFDGPVLAATVMQSGDPVVGGEFQNVGAQAAARVARWNGSAWQPFGSGIGGAGVVRVEALCAVPNGTLAVGGRFASAGGVSANNVALWTGTAWQAMAGGLAADVTSLVVFPTFEIFAAGTSRAVPAKWDGVAWSDVTGLQPPLVGTQGQWVTKLAVRRAWSLASELVAAGSFRVGGGNDVAAWDPQWGWQVTTPVSLEGIAYAGPSRLALDCLPLAGAADLAIAGPFHRVNGIDCAGAAVVGWNVADPLGDGLGKPVLATGTSAAGDLLLGGQFTSVGRQPIAALARGVAGTWGAVGGGLSGGSPWAEVRAIATAPDGATLVAGRFDFAGTASAADVARFDGAVWSTFGSGSPLLGDLTAVLPRASGEVVVGGEGGAARWNGSNWSILTGLAAGVSGQVFTLAELPGGSVVAGGDLQLVPGGARPGVMRWNGAGWAQLGLGLGSVVAGAPLLVSASCVRADGTLLVVGLGGASAFAATWNGASWQALPAPASGTLLAAAVLPDGDFVVGGTFAAIGGVPAASVARWDGQGWSAFGAGVRRTDGSPGTVHTLHWSRAGELHVGGVFERAGAEVAVHFTRLRAACPASAVPFGAGCAGSGGLDVLTARDLPWLAGTFHSLATGLPANGLALVVHGLGGAYVPLAAVLPAGLPGCTLWTTPDLLDVVVPAAGAAALALPLPSAPALVGQLLHQQVVALEWGAGGSFAALTSSNRLTLTLGVF